MACFLPVPTESKSEHLRVCGGPVVKITRLTPDWWAAVGAFEALVDVEVDDRTAQIAVMSGRRPVVKGRFEAVVNVSGAVMSSAC